MAIEKDHVIRIEREGTATRYVQAIGRGEDGTCTVTFEARKARRMSAQVAARNAERLAATLKSHACALTVARIEEQA